MEKNEETALVDDSDVLAEETTEESSQTEESSSTDTETETGEEESSTDTETETGDLTKKRFKELGLDRRFKTVEDALTAIPYFNQHIGRIEDDLKQLREQKTEVEEDKFDPERFNEEIETDPRAAIKKAGFVPASEVAQLRQEVDEMKEQQRFNRMADTLVEVGDLDDAAVAFRTGNLPQPGHNPLWDEMNKIFAQYPGLKDAEFSDLVRILKPMAQQKFNGSEAKAKVKKVSSATKEKASTTSSATADKSVGTDYDKMNHNQIAQSYAQRGMIGD